MEPAAMTALSTILAAGTTAATTLMSASAARSQANAQAQWADRQAKEERAMGQRQAGEEERAARLAKSKLQAGAAASGSGASDPTVLGLMEGINREGMYNSEVAMSDAQRRADGLTYQAALDKWSAKANSRVKGFEAAGTIIGGILGAGSKMQQRYGGKSSGRTGY